MSFLHIFLMRPHTTRTQLLIDYDGAAGPLHGKPRLLLAHNKNDDLHLYIVGLR